MPRISVFAALFAIAVSAHGHPGMEAALVRLNERIAREPADPQLYLERGELYADGRDWISAEANYLRAAELQPRLPGLKRAQGALALATGRIADAQRHCDQALALDPRDADALALRARASAAAGRRAAAHADLTAALNLAGVPRPELFLERAALASSPSDAIRGLDDGLARLGSVLVLELRALELEESSGRLEAALVRLDRLAKASERPEPWLKRRGDDLFRLGRDHEARSAYAAALRAIEKLPGWLRESPATARLAAELTGLVSSKS